MQKNLSTMMRNGNLTAREKFLLLIKNDIHRLKTGEEILTPADKDALENWKAKTDHEAREWNRLNEGWKLTGRMDIEIELLFKDAQVSFLKQFPFLMKFFDYPAFREVGRRINVLNNIKKVTIGEAVEIAKKQRDAKLREGMDFEYAVYRLALELLDPKDRKRLNKLYPDVETDHQYLDQEEVIAKLYGGKDTLAAKAKDTLAALVAERSYNGFAKEYQLFHYYACIPLFEVARYALRQKGVAVSDEKPDDVREEGRDLYDEVRVALESYAKQQGTSVQEVLREGCRAWLDEGLTDTYSPLIVSTDSAVFTRWLKARGEARAKLQQYVADGVLALRERSDQETRKEKLWSRGLHTAELQTAKQILEDMGAGSPKGEIDEKAAFEALDGEVITGESLYAFPEEYGFVRDFKEQVDTYNPNLGIVYPDDSPDGNHLDQELLICEKAPDGTASWLSLYGMSMHSLTFFHESRAIFEEVQENGETVLSFKNPDIEEMFKESRNEIIDAYRKLLAYEALFKRLDCEYEAELSSHPAERLAMVRAFLEQINDGLGTAIGSPDSLVRKKRRVFRQVEVMRFKEDLRIDIDALEPDPEAVKDHEQALRNILGSF